MAQTGGHILLYDGTQVYSPVPTEGWTNAAYRITNITKDTHVSPAFYNWFMSSAKRTLNSYTWDEINEIALAGNGPNYFSIGDTKEVILNGGVGWGVQATFNNTKYWVYIIGFDHNKDKEGIGIAFQGFKTAQSGGVDVAVVATNYDATGSGGMVMNMSRKSSGGWNGSLAYEKIMPQWKNCFPSELRDVIKPTTLYTDNTGGGSTSASVVTANSNEVYYLAEYEVFGAKTYANTNEAAQQQQYAYYKAGNSKIKYRSDSVGTAVYYWLRSPNSGNSNSFCTVNTGGLARGDYADYSYGSSPCFKVGNPPPLMGVLIA